MPGRSTTVNVKSSKGRHRPVRVLLVGEQSDIHEVLESAGDASRPVRCVLAPSLSDARTELDGSVFDLAVIGAELPDGSGLELAEQLDRSRKLTRTIVYSASPDLAQAQRAMRAGAADFVSLPVEPEEVRSSIRRALGRHSRDKVHATRVRRLRRLCKKLNKARIEVSQQVDVLCNDLVTAYQELAVQMQQVVQTSEFSAIIKDELDLEQLLRRTLEYLVEKAGPTNAAIFLPASMDEYNLGGYVNFDCSRDAADVLLQHLADVLAPKVARHDELIHIEDNQTLAQMLGDDSAYLEDSHILAFNCGNEDESLAVIALFRDGTQPFSTGAIDTCAAVGPILGEALARLIRIHHRAIPDNPFAAEEEDDDGESWKYGEPPV